jgi:hypothetical protein
VEDIERGEALEGRKQWSPLLGWFLELKGVLISYLNGKQPKRPTGQRVVVDVYHLAKGRSTPIEKAGPLLNLPFAPSQIGNYGNVIFQVPISFHGFPLLKLMPLESLYLTAPVGERSSIE